MEIIYKTNSGRVIQGDNIEVMRKLKDNSIDSCISDFPYAIEFMGKNWDSTKHWHNGEDSHSEFKGTGYDGKRRPDFYTNTKEDKLMFYNWCYERAEALYRIMKSGGYVLIFGHPKTNHRMKSAFEDAGFNIVEEIDWVYGTGFPKNQDIGKLFDKKAGAEREIIGYSERNDRKLPSGEGGTHGSLHQQYNDNGRESVKLVLTNPASELAKQWNGWKTAGLKPAHEPITVFQKPLEGTYINNIEKYGCGGMNIDTCRIPVNPEIDDMLRETTRQKRLTETWEEGSGFKNENNNLTGVRPEGRFPANVIFDTAMGEELDSQSGINTNTRHMSYKRSGGEFIDGIPSQPEKDWFVSETGGASRFFLKIDAEDFVPFLYCPKPSKKEKGEDNTHVTVKPKELIKWLIRLVTPMNGNTIDITAGSGTHGVACEELNKNEGYNLKYINIEMLNTEKEPYCEIAKKRIQDIVDKAV